MVILLFASNLLATGTYYYDSGMHNPLKSSLLGFAAGLAMDEEDEDAANDIAAPNVFPARPMLMSLAVPGLGQFYNKSPLWKTALFAGIEAAGIITWWSFKNKAADVKEEFEAFANTHWSLKAWVNTSSYMNDYLFDDSDYSVFITTHHLTLTDLSGEYYSSEIFIEEPVLVDSLEVLRDRDFYENVGKYDQFIGGWDDAFIEGSGQDHDFWDTSKDVGDSTEIILMTPNKDKYLDLRLDNNDLLKIGSYAVTAVMFNHVISAIEAVYSAQADARRKARKETDLGLIYDRKSKYGIGGVVLSVRF